MSIGAQIIASGVRLVDRIQRYWTIRHPCSFIF